MKDRQEFRKIYLAMIDRVEIGAATRRELIDAAVATFKLTPEELLDKSTNGRKNVISCMAGNVISEMLGRGIIVKDQNGLHTRVTEKPIALRIERCEEELLSMLRERAMTRIEIKDALVKFFRTGETATPKDDNKLFTFIGQILKRLTAELVIDFDGTRYKIRPIRRADAKSREEMLALMGDFLTLLHSRGGEFFEHYFMNLLAAYYRLEGKTVTESYATGGSDDGGIDGIARTVDSLGFRETVMVQTKNRIEPSVETEVRGFYGAVCAAQGSRGIFVTSSDFHPAAKKFLEGIDNCVGLTGEDVFEMAKRTSYGIKKQGDRFVIDTDII